ncbi:shikimate dehydrogenase [Sanguibacter suaedae]|uniref:Shikimate dehydrogenase n=1 Tax=Sanguibacter suaedae TaxID=2795737 RepID=A0A934MBI3_9MICO|nr:shikimate dehydrogenase [Sanguibacter suaedae]MBI9115346.1 shikimate dehydrogenase [Sanguibacter suaedae]
MTARVSGADGRRAAVLGHPVAHSLSPVLHRAAYAALGLEDWRYDALDVTEDQLRGVVDGLDHGWAGLSLTMPLKQTVIPMLDHVDPLAEVTGAVNTVVVQRVGSGVSLVGANTDVHGLVTALREGLAAQGIAEAASMAVAGAGTQQPRGSAVVLGAGATAASTLAGLAELGYPEVDVFVRSLARTGELQRAAHRMGVSPRFHTLAGAAAAMVEADLVVSTLPAHGADDLAREVGSIVAARPSDGARASGLGVLLDVAYEPRRTALAAAWRDAGGASVGGERMLLHQAVEQVRLMTGRAAPVDAMSAALSAAMPA